MLNGPVPLSDWTALTVKCPETEPGEEMAPALVRHSPGDLISDAILSIIQTK